MANQKTLTKDWYVIGGGKVDHSNISKYLTFLKYVGIYSWPSLHKADTIISSIF
jgi:hypothetical protein